MWRYRKDTWEWMKDGLEQSPGPNLGVGGHDNGNGVGSLEDTVWELGNTDVGRTGSPDLAVGLQVAPPARPGRRRGESWVRPS